MTDIAVIGEVMLELSPQSENTFGLSAAGDTYNTACTLGGLGLDVRYVTALGSSPAADSIRAHAREHFVGLLEPSGVFGHSPGLYMIRNDATGERSFDYWRNDSAAAMLFENRDQLGPLLKSAQDAPYIYFSGITLALMSPECRSCLVEFLDSYRKQGGKVIFDPNYRPALWDTPEQAKQAIERVKQQIDVYLPGYEEEVQLYGTPSVTSAALRLMDMGIGEVIIKNGPDSCTLVSNKTIHSVPISPAKSVLDTTGAGDTFNGGYIGARITGVSPEAAVAFASSAAAKVLTVRGGVLDKNAMTELKGQLERGECVL